MVHYERFTFSKNGENLHKMKKKCNKGELLNDYTPFSAKSDKTVAGRARRLTYLSRVEANPHRARLCLSGVVPLPQHIQQPVPL